jgi:outer membrane protein TolC
LHKSVKAILKQLYQGLTSLTDLLDAENAFTEAQNNYTAAVLDYKLAEIQLIKSKDLKHL